MASGSDLYRRDVPRLEFPSWNHVNWTFIKSWQRLRSIKNIIYMLKDKWTFYDTENEMRSIKTAKEKY